MCTGTGRDICDFPCLSSYTKYLAYDICVLDTCIHMYVNIHIISYIHIHTLHAHIFIPVCKYVYEEVLGVKVREGIVICEILQIWFIYKSSDYIIYVYFSIIYTYIYDTKRF